MKNLADGYVSANAQLLYPSIAVNARGNGWMAFTVAGASHFPSAAYIRFNGVRGAVGPYSHRKGRDDAAGRLHLLPRVRQRAHLPVR